MKKNENLNKFQKAFDRLKQQWNEEPKTVPQVIYRKGKLLGFNLLDTAVSAYAGQAAFMMILSFFPFVMFMLVLLQRLPLSPELLITALEHFVPQSFRTFMTDIINNIYTAQTATLLPVTVIAALWLGSKSFLSIIYGLNSVYKIPETRGYFTLRLWAMFYTLLFALLIVATLILFVFGNQLYLHITKIFPLLTHILLPIISFRSTAGFFVMLLFESTLASPFSRQIKQKLRYPLDTGVLGGAKQPKSEPLPSGASLAAISSKVMVFVPSL